LSDREFEALAKELFGEAVNRNPILGTWLGLHEYDPYLPDPSVKAELERIKLLKEFRRRFERMEPDLLPNRIDKEVALHVIDQEVFRMEELAIWRKYPSASSDLGDALYLLFARELNEERLKAMKSRLNLAPTYLEKAKERISEPIRIYVEIAREDASALPSLLRTIRSLSSSKGFDLSREVKGAEEALRGYKEWLEYEVMSKAKEEFSIGKEKFERLLKVRRLKFTVDELLKLGEEGIRVEAERLRRYARKIVEDGDPKRALKKVKAKHPEGYEEVKVTVKRLVKEAKEKVTKEGLATIPEGEDIRVIETPEYLRHLIPFAAYVPPAPFDKVQLGLYMVTPMEKEEMLKEACYSCLANILVHEAYPGHHLQLACAAKNRRPIRLLSDPIEMVEGWAFYCEEVMKEMGFYADDEGWLIQSLNALWRAVRVIVDVKLSIGEFGFDDAVRFMMEKTGMAEEAAKAEVKRYTLIPGYAMSYYLGKLMIKRLKEKAKKRWGKDYSDRRFHDMLLYEGSLPIKMYEMLL
jgi:uncharacterized protein (DUF885 family)